MLMIVSLLTSFLPLSKADPTLTVRFCSSGFRIIIMPTSEGFIYVSTGYYGLKPHSLGQCAVEYDPTTQYDRFYLVNSSGGAHYIGGYYEYEGQNESLTKILNSISERKTTNSAREGRRGGQCGVPI